ncbi:MAG: cytochrome D ubiquinol oxidase subunit I [Deltaproteobacteria bacterium RIFOXYA12_FULL_58_15]|nr:MAG: cytochrome D ubiquinol oxidase subunit I [Deltaproteobacteria bacterium RIFOXYA12_FULL_58_15]OGR14429.1 MAG: cytochrome D ubiquinol oxidase subunit I [Deltaproteobacteria bacterium RIFOXYB12_FULL_58_9]
MDVVFLSRIQFGLTAGFHYIFPPLTIGMGGVLVFLEAMFLRSRDPLYGIAARFWTKIFALNFALGVATGIVLEFQFGTNWATYSRFVGDVFGSALAAEGIFAFFLESGFLAVMVFGWDRVSPRLHFISTVMVAIGSIFSSVWIIIANSWQQTPAGHHIVQMTRNGEPWVVDGAPVLRAEIVDFWAMVFNPSTVHRLVHVLIAAFILGAFFIMSISAFYILRDRHIEFAKRSFSGALIFATIASLAALVSGHHQANSVYRTQPAKLAAFEGHFATGPAAMSLVGFPDAEEETIHFNLAIPGGLSFLLHYDFDAEVIGLDRFRPQDRPPVFIPFASYHLMVGLGMTFIGLTLLASFLWWRGTLFETRWLLWAFVFAVVGAIAANETGWIATEVGRQPWIVHPPIERDAAGALILGDAGVVTYNERLGLRTQNAGSPSVNASQVLTSIIGFAGIYLALLAVWLFVLDRKIKHGPDPIAVGSGPATGGFVDAASGRAGHNDSLTRTVDDDAAASKE